MAACDGGWCHRRRGEVHSCAIAVTATVCARQGALATKADVDALREAKRADLATVRSDLLTALSALEARLTWWLVIATGVIVAAVKLIPTP